ncbi:hypothetical protein SASPL_134939 [Salvia splendens]|uniref:PHD-type zinc finger plants domain-containing protein n=1 Tax=Salvia splendens TaxID=180675 RepID=A0A8X8WX91_SALSN|nr:hypothetical protein SASPL_134939 [Salvia splendens]
MVDVCCLCGDVGFSDKLFRCSHCRHRFQHSYCSNYYSEYGESIQVCDWCQCEKKISSSAESSSSGEKGGSPAGKAAGKVSSPRQAIRRYKLLKDVMC